MPITGWLTGYQDIFILSGFVSLFNILPGLLRRREESEDAASWHASTDRCGVVLRGG